MKPNLSEWFSDLPRSLPKEFPQLEILAEKAFKTVVANDDFVMIFDGNLKDISVIMNSESKTLLIKNGFLDANQCLVLDENKVIQTLLEW